MPRNAAHSLDFEDALRGHTSAGHPFLDGLLTDIEEPGELGLAAHGIDDALNNIHGPPRVQAVPVLCKRFL